MEQRFSPPKQIPKDQLSRVPVSLFFSYSWFFISYWREKRFIPRCKSLRIYEVGSPKFNLQLEINYFWFLKIFIMAVCWWMGDRSWVMDGWRVTVYFVFTAISEKLFKFFFSSVSLSIRRVFRTSFVKNSIKYSFFNFPKKFRWNRRWGIFSIIQGLKIHVFSRKVVKRFSLLYRLPLEEFLKPLF